MRSGLLSVAGGIAGITLLSLAQGCGNGSIPAGTVGASCSVDADCHGELSCLSQICVLAGGGAGGSAGTGGSDSASGAGGGCNVSNTLASPASGLIADFADADGGIEIMGGVFDYGTGSEDIGRPTTSMDSGSLHVTENQAATDVPQYVGVFMYFLQCVDASAFSGVKFTVSGSFSGCSMQIFACDSAHFDAGSGAALATGTPGSYQPQFGVDSSQVSLAPQTLVVPFTSQVGGSPATPLDPATLIGMDWQFTIDAAAAGSGAPGCVADLTIDDVTFY